MAEAGGAQWELAAVAAAQEETTFGGSRTSAFSLEPDAAIVVDVTHATDAPGIDVKESGKHELGSGPVLSRGSTLNDRLFELLFADRRRGEDPVHSRSLRARHRHRRRRRPRQPRRRAHGARVDPDALHALAGRARPARRRARGRAPDRRGGAAPGRRELVRALSRPPAPPAERHQDRELARLRKERAVGRPDHAVLLEEAFVDDARAEARARHSSPRVGVRAAARRGTRKWIVRSIVGRGGAARRMRMNGREQRVA